MWEQWHTGWRKWALLVGGGAFALLLILAAALEAGLMNEPVLWLVGRISGYEISCARLKGILVGNFSCENLTVADRQGTFFVAKKAALEWNFAAVIANHVSIQRLALRDARLTRFPKTRKNRSQSFLPSTKITLAHIDIQHFVLAAFKAPAVCVGLAGQAAIGPSGLSTDLKLARCHPRKGEFVIRSEYTKATGKISLHAKAADDGMLLAQSLGLKRVGATRLLLDLVGTLPALNGVMQLRASKIGSMAATFQAKASDLTRIDGQFEVAPGRLPGFVPTSGGTVSATVSYGSQSGILVHLVTLAWGGLSAKGELGASAKGALFGQLAVSSSMAHSMAGIRVGSLELGLMLGGSEAAPLVHATAMLKNLGTSGALLSQLNTKLRAARQADGALSLQLAGAATAARLPRQLSGLLGSRFSFGAKLERTAHGQFMLQANLKGNAADAELTAKLGQTTGSGALSLHVPDLVKAQAGFGGSVVANLKLSNLTLGGKLKGAFEVAGHAISAKGLGLALGNSPSLTGRIAVGDSRYQLSDLRLQLAALSGLGALSVSRSGTLLGHLAVAHGELAPLAPVLGSPLAGSFALEARASGNVRAPVIVLDADAPKLRFGSILLREVRLGLHTTLTPGLHSSLRVTAATPIGALALAGALDARRQGWTLGVTEGAIGPATLAGTLALDHGTYSGRLRMTGNVLAPAGLLLGQPAKGEGSVLVQGRDRELQLRASLHHITVASLKRASLTAMASLQGLFGPAEFTARLREGANELQLRAQARLTPLAIRLTEFRGQWATIHFGLKDPTSLQLGQGQFKLARTLISISSGTAEFAAQGGARQLLAQAQLTSLPISPFAAILQLHHASGILDGSLKVALRQSSTAAHLILNGHNLVFSSLAKPVEPADLAFVADWNGKMLTAAGRIRGFSPAPAKISLQLPLQRRADSFVPVLSTSGAVNGQLLFSDLDAGRLSALLPLAEESVKGLVTADVSLDGDIAQPRYHGTLQITKGSFSDLQTGTRLTDLDAKIVASPGQQAEVMLTAHDGGSGTIKLSGRVSSVISQPRTFGHITGNLTAVLNNAELVREDLIHGALSGRLNVNLPAAGVATISGKLRSDTVRIDLGAAVPPSIPTIKVSYAGQQAGPTQRRTAGTAKPSAPMMFSSAQLGIAVDIPNRLYIAGRGLNSEWGGHLDIFGTVGRPAFRGQLQLLNGTADVIGKTFTLQNGVVHISNALPGYANVNVTAQHSSSSIAVTLTITGPATDPKIDWSSVPALPKSEILSNLLFGSGTPQLSLGQAFQLAQMSGALSSLGVGGGGGGLLGFARNLTGLDVLNVTGPDTVHGTGASVTAGKYIGGKIYVGVTQGANTSASSAEVRITVAPHVTVTGTVGANNANSLGVDWLWRY